MRGEDADAYVARAARRYDIATPREEALYAGAALLISSARRWEERATLRYDDTPRTARCLRLLLPRR